MLIDSHNRVINYLRIAVTDRCNLRCTYCMAEETQFAPKNEVLSFEEILKIVRLLANQGINKVRITGGEPFVRKDIVKLLDKIKHTTAVDKIYITTNGVNTKAHVKELAQLPVNGVNLSLDTLHAKRFYQITKRDLFDTVWQTLLALIEHDIPTKLNVVLMDGINTDEILDFVQLTTKLPITIRFIEEMPFNGQGNNGTVGLFDEKKILEVISSQYTLIKIKDEPYSTSFNYNIEGHVGKVGVIPAYTRSFCGSCNRLRLTALGQIKTCLYGNNVLDIKQLLRSGNSDEQVLEAIQQAISLKYINGFEAEKNQQGLSLPSMSTIGG